MRLVMHKTWIVIGYLATLAMMRKIWIAIMCFAGALAVAELGVVAQDGGHPNLTSSSVPTLTAGCNGAGTNLTGATDAHGTITGQTAVATTCTLTFGTAFGAAPDCTVMGISSPLTGAVTVAAGSLVVNFASTANYKFSYICLGA